MKCYCCNNTLTPVESVRRFKASEAFTDMCDKCLGEISDMGDSIETVEGDAEDGDLFNEDGTPKDE